MLRRQQLVGTRLLRAGALLARQPVAGKTASARARLLDAVGPDERLHEWIAEEAAKRGATLSTRDVERLASIATKPVGGYRPPTRRDTAVILCHFNPVGWKTPARLLYDTCEMFLAVGVEPVVSEVVMTGATPVALPDGCRRIVYQSDSVMFHKENLWNLAVDATTAAKLFFVDGDIVFSRRDILDAVSVALDEFDVIQPFSQAAWLAQQGGVERSRKSCAEAISGGEPPILTQYHPGFAWCMTRAFFDAIGGFYDRHPLGSGDTAFAFALTPGEPPWPRTPFHIFANTQSYQTYRSNVLAASPKVGFIDGTAYHMWHGSWANRRYEERYMFLPALAGGEYPMHRRDDGLLEWDSEEHSRATLEYLLGRLEDG